MTAKTTKNLLIVSVVLNALLLGVMIFKIYSTSEQDLYVETFSVDEPVVTSSFMFNNLPSDIHPGQVSKIIGNEFALVERRSFNRPLLDIPSDVIANFAGVLRWNEEENRWEKFLQVDDTTYPEAPTKNNPLDFWWTGSPDIDQIPHIVVVDNNGAGSGEGVAKELVADNIGLTKWKVVDCYDYSYDLGKGKKRNLSDQYCQNAKISPVL